MSDRVIYVYGIVRRGFEVARAPAGLDDAPVRLVAHGQAAALVSDLPASAYAPETVEQQSGDVAWLSPRARAHDLVLTWAQEHGGVLPLPMFSLWASEASLAETLGRRSAELEASFARVAGADEFGLRVHRRDAVLTQAVGTLDEDVGRLEAEARAASPGQRYLLERKLAEHRKGAARRAAQRLARDAFDRLSAVSRHAVSRPLPPGAASSPELTIVMNGAFLVDHGRRDEFRAVVAAVMREQEPLGLVFDFTGPWPPYNFVGDELARGGARA